jgi:iron(III) transport system permease protein
MPTTAVARTDLPSTPARAERFPLGDYLLFGIIALVLAGLMIYPLLASVGAAFTENGTLTTHWIRAVLQNKVFVGQVGNSLLLAAVVTVLCNLIAFPLALIGRYYTFAAKGFWSTLVLAPMILPPFVGAIGLRRILGTFGSLTVLLQKLHLLDPHTGVNWLTTGGFWSMAVLIALGLYPIAYLNLQASLANIDPAMLEAAQNLGGTRVRNFFRITLPLARPGIFAGSTVVFIWAFTELGTPLMLQYPNVVSRAIWDEVAGATEGRSSIGFAKTVIVLAIAVTVYVLGKSTLGRSAYAMTSKAAVGATTQRLTWGKGMLAALPFAAVSFVALLPHIGVILYSFTAIAVEPASGWGPEGQFGWYRTILPDRYTLEGYRAVLQTPEIYGAIFNSLKYSAAATAVDLVLGIAIAWLIVRGRAKGKIVLDALAMLPLAIPGIVMAFGFIAVLLQMGKGRVITTGPFWILVIAYSVRRLPYIVRSATGGLEQTSVTLEEAGANLGAGPWRVLWKITLPLIMANLIAGAILTFSFAMLEVSDSLILAQMQQHYPITKMILNLGTDMAGPANIRNACSLGVVTMGVMAVLIVGAKKLMGDKLGAVFRA